MTHSRRTRTSAAVVTALATILTVTAPGRAQSLDEALQALPAESEIVVLAPSIQAVSTAAATLNTSLGLNNPALADVPALLAGMGFAEGLRLDAPVAVAIIDMASFVQTQTAGVVALLPVSDYGVFLSNFGATPGGAVDAVAMGEGMVVQMRSLGPLVAVGLDPATVAAFPERPATSLATQLQGFHQTVVPSADIALIVNVSALEPMASEGIDGMFAMMASLQARSGAMAGLMDVYHDFLSSAVRDTHLLSFAVDIRDDGISLNGAASFEAGSIWAGVFRAGASVEGLLDRLPAGPSMLAWAANLEGVDMSPMLAYAEQRRATSGETGFGNIWLDGILMMREARGFSSAWYANPGGPMQSVALYDSDGDAFRAGMQQYFTELNGQTVFDYPMEDGSRAGVSYTTTWESEVATVSDLQVDRYTMSMQLPPGLDGDLSSMFGVDFFGMTDMTGLVAGDASMALALTGFDEAYLATALEAARGGGGLGASLTYLPALRAAALLPSPASEGYLDVLALMGTLMPDAGPVELVADPMAFFGWTNAGETAGQWFVPYSAIAAVRALIALYSAEAI